MENISLMISVKVIQSMDTFYVYQNWILNYKIEEENIICQKKKMICLSLLYLLFYG